MKAQTPPTQDINEMYEMQECQRMKEKIVYEIHTQNLNKKTLEKILKILIK